MKIKNTPYQGTYIEGETRNGNPSWHKDGIYVYAEWYKTAKHSGQWIMATAMLAEQSQALYRSEEFSIPLGGELPPPWEANWNEVEIEQ